MSALLPCLDHSKAHPPEDMSRSDDYSLKPTKSTLGEGADEDIEDVEHVPILKTVSKRSPFGALLSRTLPSYSGSYNVGIAELELPVAEDMEDQHRSYGTFIHKAMPNKKAGLSLDTVLFSLFYPCEPPDPSAPKPVWFPKLKQTVDGMLKMGGMSSSFYKAFAYPVAAAAISGTTFPATPEANLLRPPAGQKWPLIVFSHGVGCSRLMYSSYCGELASRGFIVAAVEHRDGTGPSSVITMENGEAVEMEFLNYQDLHWPEVPKDKQPADDTTLRHVQLDLRCAEIEQTIKAMQTISMGEPINARTSTGPGFKWDRWGPEWDAIECRPGEVIMAGHSLGGSAALKAAADPRFKFKALAIFDPAIQRLEPWSCSVPCRVLCVNSQEFALQADFERMMRVATTVKPPADGSPSPHVEVLTIGGSTHPSFSDVFLIVPGFINRQTGLTTDPADVISQMVTMTFQFLQGRSVTRGKPEGSRPLSLGTFKSDRAADGEGAVRWYRV